MEELLYEKNRLQLVPVFHKFFSGVQIDFEKILVVRLPLIWEKKLKVDISWEVKNVCTKKDSQI